MSAFVDGVVGESPPSHDGDDLATHAYSIATDTVTLATNTVVIATNISSDGKAQVYSSKYRFNEVTTAILMILIIALITVTVVGNVIVVLAFVIDKQLRKLSNYLILNLALTDLLVGAVCIPIYLPYFLHDRWTLGRELCIFWLVIDYVIPTASAWNILLISLDRYLSVRFTLQYMAKQTDKLTIYFMATPWIIGFVTYAPAIVFWEYWTGLRLVPPDQCMVEFHGNIGYLLFGSVVEFLFPFFAILVLNILIYLDIHRRTEKKRNNALTSIAAMTTTTGGLTVNENDRHSDESNCQPNKRLERDRRFAKSIAVIILCFGCCWAPYEVMALVSSICKECVPLPVFEISFWLFWVNSTLNPLLYPFTHTQFKSAFYKMFCRRMRVGHS